MEQLIHPKVAEGADLSFARSDDGKSYVMIMKSKGVTLVTGMTLDQADWFLKKASATLLHPAPWCKQKLVNCAYYPACSCRPGDCRE